MTEALLQLIADPRARRDDIAREYAEAILKANEGTAWARVNLAIRMRWSGSAVQWIKRRAWYYLERLKAAALEAGRAA